MNLKNKTILVTGGTSGIGFEICKEIALHGGKFIALGRNGKKITKYIRENDLGECKFIEIDLQRKNTFTSLIDSIKEIDGIVHSAGIVKTVPLQFFDTDSYNEVNNINLLSILDIIQQLLKTKKLKAGSSIVLISSIAGKFAMKGNSIYAMTKASLNILSSSLANELSKKSIRCNTVSPGMVETEITRNAENQLGSNAIEADRKRYPLGYGAPNQVAKPVIFLLSDYSSWITGIDLIIDGGRTAII